MTSKAGIVDRQCKRTCDRFSVFDQKIAVEKLTGLTLLAESFGSMPYTLASSSTPLDSPCMNYISSLDKFTCQICNVDLPDGPTMRKHFRTDWHLYNMNRTRSHEATISHAEFLVKHITNTEKPDSHQNLPAESVHPPSPTLSYNPPPLSASSHRQMIYFRNKSGEIVGIHRCILFTRKNLPQTLDELLACVTRIRQSRRWAILLYSGGKFAGGIFDGTNEVVHKTLQHYTVRAKQGGGQASYDASNTGGMGGAKSAGATLRRHGEMAIRNDISNLLHNRWRAHLQACQLILLWSPKVHRNIFFNQPTTTVETCDSTTNQQCFPPLDPLATAAYQARLGMIPDDPRVHRIPCRTKHITYTVVKELHKELSTFDVYDQHADLDFLAKSERKQLRHLSESGDDTLLETRSGRLILAPLQPPVPRNRQSLSHLPQHADSELESTSSDEWEGNDMLESLEHLDISSTAERSPTDQNINISVETMSPSTNIRRRSSEAWYAPYQTWHRRLRVAVASGDYSVVKSLLPPTESLQSDQTVDDYDATHADSSSSPPEPQVANDGSIPPNDMCLRLLNHALSEGRSLLHIAVEFQSDPDVLNLLLESGCDPSSLDSEGTSPYTLATRLHKKALANVFRRFRFFHPNRYDYRKAQIPAPLDPSKEAAKAEKERERLRRQRQRAKEKKIAERIHQEKLREEEAERKRFMELSDREKRALVAERRIMATQSTETGASSQQVFSRCFQCACDISGKVPFTYSDYNFCTPTCLRAHRLGTKSK